MVKGAYEQFMRYCRLKGLSPKTMVSYESRLSLFLGFLDEKVILLIDDLSEELLGDYAIMVLSKGKENMMCGGSGLISRETARTYLNILRVFLNWTDSKGYTDALAKYVTLPKRHKKMVEIHSDEEMAEIWNSFENHNSWIEKRNKALIALMYDSGLRLSECLGLHPGDIRYSQRVILVTGKGSKQRYVPMGDFAQYCIKDYLASCPAHDHDVIFVNYNLRPLTVENVEKVFYRMRKKTGIKVSPHKLRHNFSTNYLIMQYEDAGRADIYQLMLILGHSDIRTCEIYIHMAQQVVLGKTGKSKLDMLSDKLVGRG